MVYVRVDSTEEITDWYEEKRNRTEGVVVETENGYFEYWFPIKQGPPYMDATKILDLTRMTIIEAPNTDQESVYSGHSDIIVPAHVVEKAEEMTGYDVVK